MRRKGRSVSSFVLKNPEMCLGIRTMHFPIGKSPRISDPVDTYNSAMALLLYERQTPPSQHDFRDVIPPNAEESESLENDCDGQFFESAELADELEAQFDAMVARERLRLLRETENVELVIRNGRCFVARSHHATPRRHGRATIRHPGEVGISLPGEVSLDPNPDESHESLDFAGSSYGPTKSFTAKSGERGLLARATAAGF